ncbi:hypothetical protein [Xanthomonas sp. 3075]|uniref:hypothetical protein n=1 Tax=Xanthomonas sp. 3075 TaxID=3035315 RepID=UPI0016149CE7|nr:hypothetical protein [Xanthomonas sp. 3075]MBB4132959.1 hypothetical protein [Xanthomonas sp. 3075]
MLELRNPRTIALELLSASELPHLSQDHRLPFIEIAGDFVLLDSLSAKNETEGRDAPLAGLGKDWWVFATSGTGDAWLISTGSDQHVAFLDHDSGLDATPQILGINFGQWLQLADIIRQFESTDDPNLIADTEQSIEQISSGLFFLYPYRLAV